MNPSRRQWLLVMIVVILAIGGVAVASSKRGDDDTGREGRSTRHATGPGYEAGQMACRGVRVAAQSMDSEYAGMVATVLDKTVQYADLAARADGSWKDVQVAVKAYHDAAHGTVLATTRSTRDAALEVCGDVRDPVAASS